MSKSNNPIVSRERELSAAIDELSEQFVLFDAEDCIVLTNKAWREMNSAVGEFIEPGTKFEDHLREAIKKGLIPVAIGREEEWLRERMERHRNPHGPFELERQNGLWIMIHEQRLPSDQTIIIVSDITELKRAEEGSRASEERFQAFFKNLPAKMHIKDPQGRYILINPVLEKILGVSNEEAIGKTVMDIFPEHEGEVFDSHDKAVLSTGKPITMEENFTDQDGASTFLTIKFPIRDANGKVAAVGASGIDITELKHIELLLRKREQELNSVVESSPDLIVRYDADCRGVFVNRIASKTFALAAEEIIGKTPLQRKDSGYIKGAEKYHASLEQVIKTGEPGEVEIFLKNPQGEWRIHLIRLVCERGSDGEIIGALAFGRDITEQKQAEDALKNAQKELEARVVERTQQLQNEIEQRKEIAKSFKESEERFRDIAASSSDWFWEMGPDLKLSYLDESFRDIAGVDPKTYLGKTRRELVTSSSDSEELTRHLEDLDNHLPFRDFQYELQTPDKTSQHVSVSGTPVFDASGEFMGYRGAGTNVTAQFESEQRALKAQEEMRLAKEEAEKASRAKSDFLASMSHELRTPMNAILGFAQLLELDDEEQLTESQQECVRHILDGGEHLLNLIADVLELNKIEEGRLSLSMGRVSVKEVIEECLYQIQFRAEDNEIQIFDRCTQNDLPWMWSDATRLKQILLNLLANAVKYNQPGGSAAISCEELPEQRLRIIVSDTGDGIPRDRHGDLFVPFERLGREAGKVEGTGIGLTIAKRIVESLDGEIGFESDEGQGSTFWVDLPLNDRKGEDDENPWAQIVKDSPPITRESGNGQRAILYIEDNPANMRLMENIVGQFPDITMLCAFNAELGLDLAKQHLPDLIFMDINLPGMNGIEALQELNRCSETKGIPVIAISADAMPHDIKNAMRIGFYDYITKPINVAETHRAIATIFER